MILGQDVFHAIKPLEYFQGGNQNTSVAVRMLIGCILSGPLPSPFGVRVTIFKCKNENVALADQVRKWYELESYGTFEQADPRSAPDKSAQNFLILLRFKTAAVILLECSGLKTSFLFSITLMLR